MTLNERALYSNLRVFEVAEPHAVPKYGQGLYGAGIYGVGDAGPENLLADATSLTIRRGGSRDGLGIKTDVGLMTFVVKDSHDPMNGGTIAPGQIIQATAGAVPIFTGRVAYLGSTYVLNKQNGQTRAMTTVTVSDAVQVHVSTMRYGVQLPIVDTNFDATNLINDPGTANSSGAGWAGANASIDWNDATWSISGDGDSYNIYSASTDDSYLSVGGTSGLTWGMQRGHTYVFSATGNVKVPTSGSFPAPLSSGQARTRALTMHSWNGSTYTELGSSQVPNVVGAPTRVDLEFTVPADSIDIFLRAYLGATTGQIRWDGFRLSEKNTNPLADNSDYFDGDTVDTDDYAYAWSGTADASTSTRTALRQPSPFETFEDRIERLALSSNAPVEAPALGAPLEVYSF